MKFAAGGASSIKSSGGAPRLTSHSPFVPLWGLQGLGRSMRSGLAANALERQSRAGCCMSRGLACADYPLPRMRRPEVKHLAWLSLLDEKAAHVLHAS